LIREDRARLDGRGRLSKADPPQEASLLNLVIDKAHHQLSWRPRWDFVTTVEQTVGWYRQVQQGQVSALAYCLNDLAAHLG
jgi:CDP-glucose 4,6-dehydratase